MSEYGEFRDLSDDKITSLIKGKTVVKLEDISLHGKEFIVIHFDDNSTLHIRYDYLYEWEFTQNE